MKTNNTAVKQINDHYKKLINDVNAWLKAEQEKVDAAKLALDGEKAALDDRQKAIDKERKSLEAKLKTTKSKERTEEIEERLEELERRQEVLDWDSDGWNGKAKQVARDEDHMRMMTRRLLDQKCKLLRRKIDEAAAEDDMERIGLLEKEIGLIRHEISPLRFPTQTIGDVFAMQVKDRPNHPFIMYPDRDLTWTYKDFDIRTDLMAKGLMAIGVTKGSHVGVWARNVPEWLTLMFATAKIGAVLVTINTNYKKHELEYLVKQSDMHTLAIVDGLRDVSYIDTVYELVPELLTMTRGMLVSKRFPRLKNVVYLGQEKHTGMYTSSELIQLGYCCSEDLDERLAAAKKDTSNTDMVNMQYTSGTTGFPKGVMLTHKGILNNGFYIGERQFFEFDADKNERVCLPVPLFHCFGCVLGVMAILTHGATAVMIEQFDPLVVMYSIAAAHATAVYGVPTMYIAILNHPQFKKYQPLMKATLRKGIMSGSLCPPELIKQVMEEMNMKNITNPYGLTESSPVITMTDPADTFKQRTDTVGNCQPHIDVRLFDSKTGEEITKPGVPGEVVCYGYNVMKGYYNMPEETAKTITHGGWLHSGDVGIFDEEGYLYITGRLKDMIIRGGENIYPREIEEFLLTNKNKVLDAAVVGIPDEKYGEVVGAFVIPREGVSLSENELREYCKDRIAFYKTPKHFFIVDEFPLTASGKIQKFKLREQAKKLVGLA